MRPNANFVKVATTLLTRDEETELFEQWREAREAGDRRAENRLFQQITVQFSPIVAKLVRKMQGYKLDPDDLTSEALLGLAKAAIDFDPDKGFRFGTYASNCVINTLFTYITKQYFITNVCSNNKNKKAFFGLRRHMAKQIRETGSSELTEETAQQLATTMEIDVEIVKMMNGLLRNPYNSLNVTLGEDDDSTTQQDMLESREPSQDDYMEGRQLEILHKQLITGALDTLDDRSRSIIQRSVLVDEDDRATLEQLGADFSISKERVRQIREKATGLINSNIRSQMSKRGFTPADILPVE